MTPEKKHIAIITASPALGSIIALVLEDEEQLHVEQFDNTDTLMAHMRIVPFDLIVMDYNLEQTSAAQLVLNLRRALPNRQFETMVLTSSITPEIKLACKFARIDEVVIKPMSPVFLKERVLSRMQIRHFVQDGLSDQSAPETSDTVLEKDAHPNWGGNVVPLFKSGHPPLAPNQPRHF